MRHPCLPPQLKVAMQAMRCWLQQLACRCKTPALPCIYVTVLHRARSWCTLKGASSCSATFPQGHLCAPLAMSSCWACALC